MAETTFLSTRYKGIGLTPARSLQLFCLFPLGTSTPTFGQSTPAPGIGTAGSSLSFGASSAPAQGFVGVGTFGKETVCCQHDTPSIGPGVIRIADYWPSGSRVELNSRVEPSLETQAFGKQVLVGFLFCVVLYRFILLALVFLHVSGGFLPRPGRTANRFRSPGGTPMLLLLN